MQGYSGSRTQSPAQLGGIRKLYSPSLNAARLSTPRSASVLTTNSSIQRARSDSEKELRRHLNSMMNQKQRLRRAHDNLGKAFSVLTSAIEHASETQFEVDNAAKELQAGISESVPRALESFGEVHEFDPISELITHSTATHQRHVDILKHHKYILERMIDEGQQILSEIGVSNREVLHMSTLVDRAVDVDLQCLGESIQSEALCNGSPLYPTRTVDDVDVVIEQSASFCSKGERFAAQLRRVASNGKSESMESVKQLSTTLQTSAKMAAEKIASTKNELEGITWEEGRYVRQIKELDAESEQIRARLETVVRTIKLRQTANDAVYAKEYVDSVLVALQKEEAELRFALGKIAAKRVILQRQVERVEGERRRGQQGMQAAESHSKQCIARHGSMRTMR